MNESRFGFVKPIVAIAMIRRHCFGGGSWMSNELYVERQTDIRKGQQGVERYEA